MVIELTLLGNILQKYMKQHGKEVTEKNTEN